MPLSPDQLDTKFILVPSQTPLGELHDQVKATGDLWTLVVIAGESAQYAALRLPELIDHLKRAWQMLTDERYAGPLAAIPDLFQDWTATAVQAAAVDIYQARRLARESKSGRVVVLDGGHVIGVIDTAPRSAHPADLGWFNRIERQTPRQDKPPAPPPAFEVQAPAEEPPLDNEAFDELPIGAEPPATGGGAPEELARAAAEAAELAGRVPAPAEQVEPPEAAGLEPRPSETAQPESLPRPAPFIPGAQMLRPIPMAPPPGQRALPPMPPLPHVTGGERRLNVELEGHNPAVPLRLGDKYLLDVFVDEQDSPLAVATAAFRYLFKKDETAVDLSVYLSSEDFEVPDDPQKLTVPARGPSQNRARFQISPRHEGEAIITVVVMKGANLIQTLAVKLSTGGTGAAVTAATPSGRGLEYASVVKPRDVCLVIENRGDSFHLMMIDSVKREADLRLTLQQLAALIEQARDGLRSIVDLTPEGSLTPVYQAALDVSPEVRKTSLQSLAQVGLRLFQQIFYDAGDPNATAIGDRLRSLASHELLKIQIASEQFVMPWGLLYLAEEYDPDHVDPDLFVGFKHIVEHIPLQQAAVQPIALSIDTRPHLTVACGLNTDLDQQTGHPVTQNQLAYWNRVEQETGATVLELTTAEQARQILRDGANAILYFYCHAISKGINDVGGPDASALVFSGFQSLTLGDLRLNAPVKRPLPNAPLVFINACESAELSPLFYDGFVPYFIARGARGVIGTECQIPAVFADEFGRRFFDRFLCGEPLGQAFLDLRREFLDQHNNPLGLLYALYSDGDTSVAPPLVLG